MKVISDITYHTVHIEDNIIFPILVVDWAKVDLRNIVGVVLQTEGRLYKIGIKDDVIKKLYCQFVNFNLKMSNSHRHIFRIWYYIWDVSSCAETAANNSSFN